MSRDRSPRGLVASCTTARHLRGGAMLPGPRNEEEKVAVGGEETAGEERVAWSEQQEGVTRSGLQDYLTLFRMMSPAFAGSSLASAEEYCRSPDCTKSECLALSFSRHCGPVFGVCSE